MRLSANWERDRSKITQHLKLCAASVGSLHRFSAFAKAAQAPSLKARFTLAAKTLEHHRSLQKSTQSPHCVSGPCLKPREALVILQETGSVLYGAMIHILQM